MCTTREIFCMYEDRVQSPRAQLSGLTYKNDWDLILYLGDDDMIVSKAIIKQCQCYLTIHMSRL